MQNSLSVQGMSCGHCVKAIESSVSEITGVHSVHVSLTESKVTVDFDESMVSLPQIEETIEEQGYEVK